MSETAAADWIDLTRADDPRDVVHRAVACLAQGGVVGLPTETTYALAASALHPEAVGRLRSSADGGGPPAICLRGAEEAPDWVPDLSPLARRLARRAWPGPVDLVLGGRVAEGLAGRLPAEVRPVVTPGDAIVLGSPAHDIVREILRLVPGPLLLAAAPRDGQPAATTAESLRGVPGLDMVLDDGPTPFGAPATVVRVEPDGWRVVRPGAVGEEALTRMVGTIIMFVCTGNTCRSPMAEALCKAKLAGRLGCRPEELEARGYVVLSAGLSAIEGQPAASHAAEIVRALGGSLREHASRRITAELVRQADYIIAMTRDHRDALLAHAPEAADRTRLLDPSGEDVDDPIGADRDTYRRTADAIAAHLGHLIDELGG